MSSPESQTPNLKPQTPTPEPWVAGVRFQPTGKVYGFDASGCGDLRPGDFVLVETARGQQLGEVVSVQPLREGENKQDLKPVQRRATGHDLAIRQHWRQKEAQALDAAHEADGFRADVIFCDTEASLDEFLYVLLLVNGSSALAGAHLHKPNFPLRGERIKFP